MKKRFSPKKTAAFCTVSVLLALIIWTVWGNTALMVSTAAISSSRIPPAFSGFRIAQVSDLHNAEFGKDNSTLLRMLSESGPDIIVITGDLVDSTHTDIDTQIHTEDSSLSPSSLQKQNLKYRSQHRYGGACLSSQSCRDEDRLTGSWSSEPVHPK